jgi:hypothetical protein
VTRPPARDADPRWNTSSRVEWSEAC